MTLLLSPMKAIRHSSYVCGDYNIDLLKVKTNKHYGEHFDDIISQGFIPKITLPTPISEHSSTLIDNNFTSNIDEKESPGILLNQISDRQMIFTLIENKSYVTHVPKFVEIQNNDHNSDVSERALPLLVSSRNTQRCRFLSTKDRRNVTRN